MKLKDIHEFNYDRISREMWDKKLQHAMKKFGISFDTENNDKIDEKTITIEQKHWETTKCQIICQAWAAGGDWETSTMYFKCQVKEGYFNIDGESMMSDAFFIFIPDNKNGNYQLEESDSGLMPIGDDDNEEDLEYDEQECWAALEKYLNIAVKEETKKSKEQNTQQH